ncbi:MAG: hypothetical protein J3K34DRAFT_524401 [Monoraphidium minutum]|nr:MAG: hypothetical protein J3K34DRAFT_524401 [Monoraphidium minutum]
MNAGGELAGEVGQMAPMEDVYFDAPLVGWLQQHLGFDADADGPSDAAAPLPPPPRPLLDGEASATLPRAAPCSPFTHVEACGPLFASLAHEVTAVHAAQPVGLVMPVAPGTAAESRRRRAPRAAAAAGAGGGGAAAPPGNGNGGDAVAGAGAGPAAAPGGRGGRPQLPPLRKDAGPEEREARRRALAHEAQRRFRARRRGELDTLTAEVEAKRALLGRLAVENEGLRARERLLQNAARGGEDEVAELGQRLEAAQLSAGSASGGAGGGGGSSSSASGPALLRGGSGDSGGGVSVSGRAQSGGSDGAPGSLDAASRGGSGGSGALSPAAGLGGGAAPALIADAVESEVLRLPPNTELPPEVVVAARRVYRAFIDAAAEALALQEGEPRAPSVRAAAAARMEEFTRMMRCMQARNPLARQQLVLLNLETGAREEPPPAHWASVVERTRARVGPLQREKRVELREAVELYRTHMAELRQEQEEIKGTLAALAAARGPPSAPAFALDEGAAVQYAALLGRLETALRKQHALDNVFIWGCEKATPRPVIMMCYVYSFPFLPAWTTITQFGTDSQPIPPPAAPGEPADAASAAAGGDGAPSGGRAAASRAQRAAQRARACDR